MAQRVITLLRGPGGSFGVQLDGGIDRNTLPKAFAGAGVTLQFTEQGQALSEDDVIVEVNGTDVLAAGHSTLAELVRGSGQGGCTLGKCPALRPRLRLRLQHGTVLLMCAARPGATALTAAATHRTPRARPFALRAHR